MHDKDKVKVKAWMYTVTLYFSKNEVAVPFDGEQPHHNRCRSWENIKKDFHSLRCALLATHQTTSWFLYKSLHINM